MNEGNLIRQCLVTGLLAALLGLLSSCGLSDDHSALPMSIPAVTLSCPIGGGKACQNMPALRASLIFWTTSPCTVDNMNHGLFAAQGLSLLINRTDCGPSICSDTVTEWYTFHDQENEIKKIPEGVYTLCVFVDRNDNAIIGDAGDFIGKLEEIPLNVTTEEKEVTKFEPL